MTINPSTVGNDAYDMLDGSLSSFYQDVDEAIVASEVVKGQYRLTVSPAYNSPNPVSINNFTTLALSQSGPMVVDLENSYITTTATMKFRFNEQILAKGEKVAHSACFFIGWKSSVEAIERYDILVNSTPIYNQAFCGEESFLQYQTLNENVKHTSPYIYSSYDEVINMSPNVCGTYVIIKTKPNDPISTADTFTAHIPIKIPITNFMILKNLKYLLSWMGKWELRVYFNYTNMVIMPIDTELLKASTGINDVVGGMTSIEQQFVQIGQPFKFLGNDAANAVSSQSIAVSEMSFNDVEMVSAQFQLRMDICEMLKQKYLGGKPLTFPVSTFQIARFTCPAGNGIKIQANSSGELNSVLCQAINNCDTLFILPYMTPYEKTICYNPHVQNFQLHAGEYGTYPTQPFDTWQVDYTPSTRHIRYLNIIGDSLNVNSSSLTSFNTDVLGAHYYQLPVSGNHYNDRKDIDTAYKGPNGKDFDKSNFFFAIPFSTDDDFQGGLSSPASNINFKITGQIKNLGHAEIQYETPWVAAFLIDGVIMIRPDPGSDAANVIWSDRTVV